MTIKRYPSELSVEEFKSILCDPEITRSEDRLILETLYSFNGHEGFLKDVIAFHNNPSLRAFNNMQFVKRIGAKFDIRLKDREYRYCHVLFDGEDLKQQGYKWILKPELVIAMEELGLTGQTLRKNRLPLAEEVFDHEKHRFPEGGIKTIMVNAYERNPAARQCCIDEWGLTCVVCGFNFEDVYGDLGKEYIHIHHLTPLSDIGETYEIDPVNDLRPVCPNCHAMLHRRNPPLTIEGMKRIRERMSL